MHTHFVYSIYLYVLFMLANYHNSVIFNLLVVIVHWFCAMHILHILFMLANYHSSVIFHLVVVIVHWFSAIHISRILFICIFFFFFLFTIIVSFFTWYS